MRVEVEISSADGKKVAGYVHLNETVTWLKTPVISLVFIEKHGLNQEVYVKKNRYWCDLNCKAILGGDSPKNVTFRVARVNFTDNCVAII